MVHDATFRQQKLRGLTETLECVRGLSGDRAGAVSQLLWKDIAEIEMGWRWHDVGPDGLLLEAQRLLAADHASARITAVAALPRLNTDPPA